MTEDAGEFNPIILFGIVVAVFANEYFSVLALMS